MFPCYGLSLLHSSWQFLETMLAKKVKYTKLPFLATHLWLLKVAALHLHQIEMRLSIKLVFHTLPYTHSFSWTFLCIFRILLSWFISKCDFTIRYKLLIIFTFSQFSSNCERVSSVKNTWRFSAGAGSLCWEKSVIKY